MFGRFPVWKKALTFKTRFFFPSSVALYWGFSLRFMIPRPFSFGLVYGGYFSYVFEGEKIVFSSIKHVYQTPEKLYKFLIVCFWTLQKIDVTFVGYNMNLLICENVSFLSALVANLIL